MNYKIIRENPVFGWGVFALIVIVIAYYFGSRTGKAKTAAVTGKAYQNEIAKTQLTYELSQYAGFADRLETAMFGFTDDEESIYSVFTKLRTKSDVLQLITSFGSRRLIWTIGSASLPVWINKRLSQKEVGKINEILSRNNINYQF